MPNEITDAAARSAKASKTLDTMRARIVKADEARTDAAHEARAAQVAARAARPRPRPRTAKRPRRGMPWRPMPPNKPASVATAQSWPTARAAGGRAREPRPGLSVLSSRPARRPRAVGSVTVRAGLDRAGAPRRPIPASRAAAGRVCHPEGRSRAEDGAAVDTPDTRRLSGPFLADGGGTVHHCST